MTYTIGLNNKFDWMSVHCHGNAAHILDVSTESSERRAQKIEEMLEKVKAHGEVLYLIWTIVPDGHPDALIYQRIGFDLLGQLREFCRDGKDAYVYGLPL